MWSSLLLTRSDRAGIDRCASQDGEAGGAGWDGIGGDDTIVPMTLNYSQQKALAMQWKAAGPALSKARHAGLARVQFESDWRWK